jgi:hypothetical protein
MDIFFRSSCEAPSQARVVLKLQTNKVDISAVVLQQLPTHKFYLLMGYGETLLSHFYK